MLLDRDVTKEPEARSTGRHMAGSLHCFFERIFKLCSSFWFQQTQTAIELPKPEIFEQCTGSSLRHYGTARRQWGKEPGTNC